MYREPGNGARCAGKNAAGPETDRDRLRKPDDEMIDFARRQEQHVK
jgi:hypothetical protein